MIAFNRSKHPLNKKINKLIRSLKMKDLKVGDMIKIPDTKYWLFVRKKGIFRVQFGICKWRKIE